MQSVSEHRPFRTSSPAQLPLEARSRPIFSAAVYCSGGLDDIIRHVLVPFLREARKIDETTKCWFFRYGRGGEHLKVRASGLAENRQHLRSLFSSVVEDAWDLIPSVATTVGKKWLNSPVIDPEDLQATEPSERCLIWTSPSRSSWVFGVGTLKHSDRYTEWMTACLTAGCERLLPCFEGGSSPNAGVERRRVMLGLITEATVAAGWPLEASLQYLSYHRDSIIRFLLVSNKEPTRKAEELLRRFHKHSAGIVGERSGAQPRPYYTQCCEVLGRHPTEGEWANAVRNLIVSLRSLPMENRQDPFAQQPLYTPLFKVLHLLANALGIGLLNESYLYHLLLAGSELVGKEVVLEPTWEWACI